MAKATPNPAMLTTPAQLTWVSPPVESGGKEGGVVSSTGTPTLSGVGPAAGI